MEQRCSGKYNSGSSYLRFKCLIFIDVLDEFKFKDFYYEKM